MPRALPALTACVLVCTFACGGAEFDSPGAGGTGAAGATGGGAGGAGGGSGGLASGGGGAPASACPPQKPIESESCATDTLACSYGDDPRPECRWRYRCESGKWQGIDQPDVATCNTLGVGCPASPPSGSCTVSGDSCVYKADGVFCRCSSVSTTTQWRCSTAPPPPCPPLLPNEGELCSGVSSCDFACNVESQGVQASCKAGVWVWEPCP